MTFAPTDRLPPLQEVCLPSKPLDKEAKEDGSRNDISTCDTYALSNGLTMSSMRSVPSADSMKYRVKNTFLHFEGSADLLNSSGARRSRTLSPQPRAQPSTYHASAPVLVLEEDRDDDDVSVPDTDDGISPTVSTEQYRKFFSEFSDSEDSEYDKKQAPTPPLVTGAPIAQPMMLPGCVPPGYWVWHPPTGTAATPAEPAENTVTAAAKAKAAGMRREATWKSMSAGLAKPEVPEPEPAPASKPLPGVQGELVQFVYDMMVQKGFTSPRGHLLLDVYVEVWREIVGTANATGGKTALDRFAGLLSAAPQLFEVSDVNVVPCALRTRSCYGVDNRETMVRLKPLP